MKRLVIGATGHIGSLVTERLLARAEHPRVFVRCEDKARARFGDRVEVAVGDLGDPASLAMAMHGIESVFLVSGGAEVPRHDAAVASAAMSAGGAHVVKLSSLAAGDASSQIGGWHAQGEAAVRESGVPHTFVRASGFMSNSLAWAPAIKAEGAIRASTGDGRIAVIHPDDIASVAVEALTTRHYDGQMLSITGPEALSYTDMASKLGATIGRSLVFEAISDEQARDRLLSFGMPSPVVDALVELWRSIREGRDVVVTSDVARVLAREPISFDRWAAENAAVFR